MLTEILLHPAFIASAVVILGGSLAAVKVTGRKWPGKSTFTPRKAAVDPHRPQVTFADVAGLDDAIAELREVEEFLADPERFRSLGAELPRGILLYGPRDAARP